MSKNLLLTQKQIRFIDEYVKCYRASKAAVRSGYSVKTARQVGYENLRKPKIRTEIIRLLEHQFRKISPDHWEPRPYRLGGIMVTVAEIQSLTEADIW